MKQIIFATGNAGKMKEIREILNGTGWNVLSLKDAGIDAEIEENGTTFEEKRKDQGGGASETGVWKTGFRAVAGFRRKKLLCWRMIPDWKSTGWAESRAFILRYMGHETSYREKTPTSSAVWTASQHVCLRHCQPCSDENSLVTRGN